MKLSAKYYGPFKVIERVGQVAYRLEHPPGARVHPVFYVSLLKLKLGQNIAPSTELPEMWPNSPPITLQAIFILSWPWKENKVLVHWNGDNPTKTTWENRALIKAQFSKCFLQDEESVEERRNVMEA